MDINLLTEDQLALLNQLISESEHIVICCHKSPDGDALGASLAWAEFLRSKAKLPLVAIPDAFPDYLRWLPCTETLVRYDRRKELVEEAFRQADLVFCLDFNSTSRVDEMEQALASSPAKKVLIDHHLNPDMDTVLSISYPEMSSTCELVFRILWQMGEYPMMTRKMTLPIYCGMMTDTGGFTYNSTRPEIYFIISMLLDKRIDKDLIYRNVYNNYSEWAIRLRGYIMDQKLHVFEQQHAAYYAVTRSEMAAYHFIKGDLEGLVNEPLRIKGMKLSISLREDSEKDNLIWVSLRSVDDFPCNLLAERFFNGGGHLNASGGKLFCSMDEAEEIVRKAISQASTI